MDDVFKMYAMSDGDPFGKPGDLDSGRVEAFADEEDDLETSGILTSSDDDEVEAEETVIAVIAMPAAPPKPKKPAAKKAAAKKAPAKKAAAKKAPAKKAAQEEGSGQESGQKEGPGQESRKESRQEKGSGEEGCKESGQEESSKEESADQEGCQESSKESQEGREEEKQEVEGSSVCCGCRSVGGNDSAIQVRGSSDLRDARQKGPANRWAFLRLMMKRFDRESARLKLLEMQLLMADVILDQGSERYRLIVAHHAHCLKPILGNLVHYGHQDLVLCLPPAHEGIPWLVAIAVSVHPRILGVAGTRIPAIDRGADESLAIVSRRIEKVAYDLLSRPPARPPRNIGKLGGKRHERSAKLLQLIAKVARGLRRHNSPFRRFRSVLEPGERWMELRANQ